MFLSDRSIPQLPYETPVDLSNFITALRQADLVDLKWGSKGMLCGDPRLESPKVLTLLVADEADAWIINRAKEAVSRGDDEAARAILAEITQDQGTRH
jgi:hypothetical protein